ncbi:hypothetical protein [Streptomyces flavofungini]|uniref:hypothetical protein n=1 Tax=Streptomyces flavofungini TaxID=68200 RepID=UPI0025AFAB54|nr:hypothetical protein [Streptomyces flavofungini]WJV46913.1 hypothetical protein QUY26_16085 [Streptomyces flavofungini]
MPNAGTPSDETPYVGEPAGPNARQLDQPIDWAATRERAAWLRRRRKMIGGATAVVLVAGASIGVWLSTRNEEKAPVKHTAEMPTGFGDYRLAGKGDKSLWSATHGGDNLDPAKETAHATYVRPGSSKSYMVTLELDPPVDVSDPGEDDDVVSALLNTSVDSGKVRSYSPGSIGGTLRCVEYGVANTTSSRCVWGNDAATVTAQPVITSGPRPKPDETAKDVRAFLAKLRIRPVK